MRAVRATIRIPLILVVVIIASAAKAAPQSAADILLFPVGDMEASIPLGGSATFTWVAYNNGTTQHLVVPKLPQGGDLVWTVSPLQVLLAPGGASEIRASVRAPDSGVARTARFPVDFTVTNLATSAVGGASFPVTITVLGVTEASNPRGKIFGVYPNPLPAPLDNEWAAFAITVGFWLFISAALVYIVDPVLRSFAKRTKTRVDDTILGIVRGPVFALLVVFGAVNSLEILGLPAEWAMLLERIYSFIFILIATWIAYRIFRDLLVAYGRELAARTSTDVGTRLIPAIDKVGAMVIVVLGFILAFQSLGYDITLFLAGLGVAGLIIAFAAQDTLSNFFAGIHLMLDRPFRVGELIQLDTGEICEVRDIGLRSTKLYWGRGNMLLILPNNLLAGTKIVNFTRPDLPIKVHITVGVAYGTPVDKLRPVLLEIANGHPDILKGEAHSPAFQIDDFGDSAIMVRLIFWVNTPQDQWRIASEVREQILKRFTEEGIAIPFPQRVVWTARERPEP